VTVGVTGARALAVAATAAAIAAAATAVAVRAQPSTACAAASGPETGRLTHPRVQLAWRAQPEPIVVGRPFAIEFDVCPASAGASVDRVRVDASMPAHRHGMNYQPRIAQPAPGRFRAEGLLWHMPGTWQVLFEMRVDGEPVRLTQDVAVR
jgi:hypothetical protein